MATRAIALIVLGLSLAGCVVLVVNSVTTLTVAREASEAELSEDERAVALEVAKAVAAQYNLKTTKARSRLPAHFGDGEIFIEVWARSDPTRFEFLMTEYNVYVPTRRGKEIRRAIEEQVAERLPGFSLEATHDRTQQVEQIF